MTRADVVVFCEAISMAHVVRPLAVGRALSARGFHVVFACGDAYRNLLLSEGIEPVSLFSASPEHALRCIRRSRTIYDDDTLERYVNADLQVLETYRPRLIVGDMRPSLNISAELAQVPYVSLINAYWTRYFAANGRAPETFIATRILGRPLTNALFPFVRRITSQLYARPFNRLRRRLNLRPAGDMFEVMASPFLNLLVDTPCFMPCADLPSHYRYVGPVLWQLNGGDASRWLDHLSADRPVVYFSMGSTGSHELMQTVLNALAGIDCQVVLSTGPNGPPAELPRNCTAVRYAPGRQVLRKSRLLVCHGGNGTIYQALAEGVPIVGLPTFFDQEINMDQVEDLGLGVKVACRKHLPADIRRAVLAVLEDPGYKQRAEAFKRFVKPDPSAQRAADEVGQLLSGLFQAPGPDKPPCASKRVRDFLKERAA